MVVEEELRNRFVAELTGFIGLRVAVFDKQGLLAVGRLVAVDPRHLNLYLRDAWVYRPPEGDGEPYCTPKLLVKGEVLARLEVAQPGGPYLNHRGEPRLPRRAARKAEDEF